MKLSIIIPMYGVERYIEKCLLSCIRQDSAQLGIDYEIICVNDGTKDRSAIIARSIADKYKGINIVDQENQGLSVARNTGTDIANGEYIWYVDSDDYIEDGSLKRILPKLNDEIDILSLHYRLVYEDGRPSKDMLKNVPEGVYSGREVTLMGGLSIPAPFSIFRTSYIKENGFRFVSGIYHEDMEFKPRVSYLADKIAFDNDISYNYLQRKGTIMSTFRPKRIYDLMTVIENLLRFSQKYVDDVHRKKWTNSIAGPFSQMLFLANKSNDCKVQKDTKRFVIEHEESTYVFTCSKSLMLRCVGYISYITGINLYLVYSFLYKMRYNKSFLRDKTF